MTKYKKARIPVSGHIGAWTFELMSERHSIRQEILSNPLMGIRKNNRGLSIDIKQIVSRVKALSRHI